MKRALIFLPYAFITPQNGGALRCFYLVQQLSKTLHLTLVTVHSAEEVGQVFPHVEVVSTNTYNHVHNKNGLLHKLWNACKHRWYRKKWNEPANEFFLQWYSMLKKHIKQQNYDWVIFENLEMVNWYAGICRKYLPSAKLIYDAHNVDSVLWQNLYKANPSNNHLLQYAKNAEKIEKSLHQLVNACTCCSEVDANWLNKLNKQPLPIVVIPNGVAIADKPFDTQANKTAIKNLLFCGTLNYQPNEEAIYWFCQKVLPLIQETNWQLWVVGKGASPTLIHFLKQFPPIKLIGEVASVNTYYHQTGIAIAPLQQGSGTRLKILEAMSLGSPIVSTKLGAEGIDAIAGEHLLIADSPKQFAEAIQSLWHNTQKGEDLRREARLFVEKNYDWEVIGHKLRAYLHSFNQ